MLVKLIEVKRGMRGGTASLSEIYVNSSHIVSVSEDVMTTESLINEAKQLGLVEGIRFSKVVIAEGSQIRTLTVVGTPSDVYSKVKKRQILRG
jgi:hypothetical protein